MSAQINSKCEWCGNIGSKILYISVDVGQGKSRQLSVHLLGWILITRGAGAEQKQMQKILEFVDSVNILLPAPR